jgi:DNA/RNA-binding domain of Phe-tRNA-synthetase-like protein
MEPQPARVAVVWGLGLPGCPKTSSTPQYLSKLLDRVRASGDSYLSSERKTAVRQMLRFGKYKPSGRSKPSSEYLIRAALSDEFPLVNGPADANNAVSLEWGYPASIFDMELCGTSLYLRRGVEGESYIFNPSGQNIDLRDLLCVCCRRGDNWVPCGNPVKDSMATKIRESTQGVVAVIYAPSGEAASDPSAAAERFAELLRTECAAIESGWTLPQ